ncbi:DNA-binding protein RFX7 [Orchesella cincta]|uniref:DNA-binding protein RFX7 n=1 Tax=Orchesella cincta TaxID=48709 RepID=A0A1D2N212_ORCCI|nr:DNA-binding protein RFX7 [Orchesella cincta]
MDSLRSTNLSTVLSDTKGHGSRELPITLNKDNVSKLVKTFSELSKHEKILFLINIREFTKETNHGSCNGTMTPTPTITITPSVTPTPGSEDTGAACSSSNPSPQVVRLSRTSNWLQKTFIQDNQVALPKEEVYALYKHEFLRQNEKPISTADFGKLMRQVFPDVKARRLGQRGQSKYCYANIRKRSEIEKPAPSPLPQNELLVWAKNKFNIDFSDVGQVVSYLKSENSAASAVHRKRRASCGGNVLKQKKQATRSASVSVLELEEKDDPLMILNDNESLEIGSYFESSTSSNWPQLRSLLTDESVFSSATSSKKKRHSSSVQFEFIKPELQGSALLHRSQSVPVTEMSFIRNPIDELQSTSTSSIFDELSASGEQNNPLFSSAVTKHNSTNSSCSSNSSVMFESIDVGVVSDVGGSGSSISGLLLNGNGANPGGSDVFFDSVFDLMMSDCQN